jgi:CRISPR system Cascade subunit CasA
MPPGPAGLVAVFVLATGCADYSPAPVSVEESVHVLNTRILDPEAARSTLTRIAPGYRWEGDEWNVLALFAEALRLNPELARARATYASANADIEASRVSPGFTLSLAAEYAVDPPESSNWLYGVAADTLIDRGGRREGRIAGAEILARAAALDYESSAWSVRQRIRRSLDASMTRAQEVKAADALVSAREQQFETMQRRVTAGETARTELERVRASLADSIRIRTAARSALDRSRLDLAAAIGVLPAAIDRISLVDFSTDDIEALPPLGSDFVDAALEGRPEILHAMLTYDRTETDLRVAVASQYPEIRLGPGYTWERGLTKLPFALSLSFPERDFSQAAIAAAEARRAEAGTGLEAAVSSVIAGVSGADADYRAALSMLEVIRAETLPTAEALADQASREFDAGAIDRAGWAASQAGLYSARLDEISAIRAVLEAEAGLEDALRRPLRGPDAAASATLMSVEQDAEP